MEARCIGARRPQTDPYYPKNNQKFCQHGLQQSHKVIPVKIATTEHALCFAVWHKEVVGLHVLGIDNSTLNETLIS
jgi:hypothetical protein